MAWIPADTTRSRVTFPGHFGAARFEKFTDGI